MEPSIKTSQQVLTQSEINSQENRPDPVYDKTQQQDDHETTQDNQSELVELFEDDGTLDLLRLAVVHPSLKLYCDGLVSRHLPQYNSLVSKYNSLFPLDKSENMVRSLRYRRICTLVFPLLVEKGMNVDLNILSCPQSLSTLSQLRVKCLELWEDLDRDTLNMDCLDLENIKSEWGTKSSIRQARKEIVNICERLSCSLEKMCKALADGENKAKNKKDTETCVKENSVDPSTEEETCGLRGLRANPHNKRSLLDVKSMMASHPGLCASAPSVRKIQRIENPPQVEADLSTKGTGGNNSSPTPFDSEQEESHDKINDMSDEGVNDLRNKSTKRSSRAKRNKNTDWGVRVRDKIKYFKEHTSKGGCVTTLYDHPVNRDTMLSLLAKCEPYLNLPNPTPYQMKLCIETFIAGLDTALSDLQQLRVNKTQMRLLYQSALVLDTLSTPAHLLPEVKSLQGLLKTFGLF